LEGPPRARPSLWGFAQATVLSAALGVAIAALVRRSGKATGAHDHGDRRGAHRRVAVPPVTAGAAAATAMLPIPTHVAAVVIPVIARQLDRACASEDAITTGEEEPEDGNSACP
jgi:hypothetical protein